jgi:hypothetical protein
MPELYGNSYKWELRNEIAQLNPHLSLRDSEVLKLERTAGVWNALYRKERERREALEQKLQEFQGSLSALAAELGELRERSPPEQQN